MYLRLASGSRDTELACRTPIPACGSPPRGRVMARSIAGFTALAAVALAITSSPARADIVYVWHTTSATVNGAPNSSLSASAEITLTDAGFASGSVGVSSAGLGLGIPITQTLNGVASASFQMIGLANLVSPGFTVPQTGTNGPIVNFTATVNGQFLDVTPIFHEDLSVDYPDTEAYGAVAGPGNTLTVGYGTDNGASICYGPEQPGSSKCVVSGYFQQVPEPGTLPIVLTAFGILGIALRRVGGRGRPVVRTSA